MATTVTRYIDPDAQAGGNGTTSDLTGGNCAYTSANAWEAARQRDISLSTGDDTIERAICQSTHANHSVDASAWTIDGWTTATGNYITVEAAAASRAGAVWDTAKYRGSPGHSSIASILEDHVRLSGLQLEVTASYDTSSVMVQFGGAGSKRVYVDGCYFRMNGSYHLWMGLEFAYGVSGTSIAYVRNCIFANMKGSDRAWAISFGSTQWNGSYIHDCTFDDCYQGISFSVSVSTTIKGNLFRNCTTDMDGATAVAGSGYNATTNSSLSYSVSGGATGDRTSQTFTFSTGYRLDATDAGAKGYGADLDQDANWPVTVDIEGNTRHATTPCIGAYEYVSGITRTPFFTRRMRW
jgi:hypothetical protein